MSNFDGKKWIEEDLKILYTERMKGTPYKVLSRMLNRTSKALETKYNKDTNWKDYHFYQPKIEQNRELEVVASSVKRDISIQKSLDKYRVQADIVADKLYQAARKLPTAPQPPVYVPNNLKKCTNRTPEDMGLILSDLHIGHEHTLEETGGLSEYNVEIFIKRLDNLKKAITDIKELHSKLYKIPTLHIFSLGDIVEGTNTAGQWSPVYINTPIFDQVMIGYRSIADFIYYMLTLFEKVEFYGLVGNHGRCLSECSRVLTTEGYKFYYELSIGDKVGTINPITQSFEFNKITHIHVFDEDKELIGISRNSLNMKITADHDVLHRSINTKILNKNKASDLQRNSSSTIYIPISANSKNKDLEISDDMLNLLGWIMTDGSISKKSNALHIWQNKKHTKKIIRNLLNKMNLKFSEKIRTRKINKIMNVETKKENYKCDSFYINASDIGLKVKTLLPVRKYVPDWMYKLSDRQVRVLLLSLVSGDGYFRKNRIGKHGYNIKGGPDCIWGDKDFLDQLTGLFISHGIPCGVKKHKRSVYKKLVNGKEQNSYYLQIRKTDCHSIKLKNLQKIPYKGKTWCVTVKNGTIACLTSQGEPFFTGNCAVTGSEKYYNNFDLFCYKYLELELSGEPRINFTLPKTWWLIKEIQNHKFLMVHGDDVKGKNPPISSFLELERKMTGITKQIPHYTLAGHFHNSSEYTTHNGKILLNGSFPGSDVYSLRNAMPGTSPEQKLFGIHPKRGITWTYNINLKHDRS